MIDILVLNEDFPDEHILRQISEKATKELFLETELSGEGCESSPDTDLVKLARRGDKAAFATLTEIYWTPIYCYLLRLLGQAEQAADLTQETFFKAFQSIGEIPGSRELNFRAWLYRIATNLALSELRRTKKRAWFSLDWLNEHISRHQTQPGQMHQVNYLPVYLVDRQLDPGDQSLASEQSHQIVAVFAQLPYNQTILLLLRFYHELSYDEISQILGGLRQDAVRARLHRARLAFCRLFEERNNEEKTEKDNGPHKLLGNEE